MTEVQRPIINYAKPYGYIYSIRNKVNNKRYIGQTLNKEGFRKYSHTLKGVLRNYYINSHLCSSFKKYGIERFEFKIIDSASNQDELNKKEEYYIQKYNTLNDKYGYNLRHGGSNGKLTKKAKEKISKANKGKIPWTKGKSLSEDHRKRISEAKKGKKCKPCSEDRKKKLSETLKKDYKNGKRVSWSKGKKFSNEHKQKISEGNKGRICSKETRRKISEALKGKIISEKSRKKMSISHKSMSLSNETKKKISELLKGRNLSEEHKKKLSEVNKGKVPWNKGKHYSKEQLKNIKEGIQKYWERKRQGIKNV